MSGPTNPPRRKRRLRGPPAVWVLLDGEIVEESRAAIPATDRGLLYGHGLFETMRSYAGRVFLLEEHYERLLRGMKALGIDVYLRFDRVRGGIDGLLAFNGLEDAFIRLTLTAGPGHGFGQTLIQARPPLDYPESMYERGATAITSSTRRNETSPLCAVKSLNYLDNLLARQEARRTGAAEALLLNSRGLVAEGSASNVFLVAGGALLTPGLSSGALPGVTRAAVLGIASRAGLEPVEAEIGPETLLGADEAFLTNSLMEIMPLVELDGATIGPGTPGPATRRLHALYRKLTQQTR